MSERKVLNKYYAPDFDDRFKNRPKRLREKKEKPEDRQFHVRIMAPCNMRCNTCGEYIAKAKKFNSRQETVKGETFLGLRVFRFYIRCPRCMAEISFKTDLKNEDYELEQGATRNFQAQRFAEMQAAEEEKRREQEEADNPMLALEKRTRDSLNEMERLDSLEDLRDISKRHSTLDPTELLKMNSGLAIKHAQNDELEDEEFVRSIYGRAGDGKAVKRVSTLRPDDAKRPRELASADSSDDESDDDELDLEAKCNKLFSRKRTETKTTAAAASNAAKKTDDAATGNVRPSLPPSDIFLKPYAVSYDDTIKKSLKSAIRIVKKPQDTAPDVSASATTHTVLSANAFRPSCIRECQGESKLSGVNENLKSVEEKEVFVHNKTNLVNSTPASSIGGLVNYGSDDESD